MASVATAHFAENNRLGGRNPRTPLSPGSKDDGGQRETRQKAAQFLREAEKNRRQIERLEKESTLVVQCRKNGWTDLCRELETYEKVMEKERNAAKQNMKKQLLKIHSGVRKFQKQLTDVKPTPELIDKLKEIMSEVEISITTLKEEQQSRFKELFKEEKACSDTIIDCQIKISDWTLAVKSDSKVTSAPAVTVKSKPLDRHLPTEVIALDSFLQRTGGSYGGWDQDDHQTFLKTWTKHNGQPGYKAEARLFLPGKTIEEIEQHEDWYQELIRLQNKKRAAIQRWKASKEQERQVRIQSQDETEETERREKEARIQNQQHKTEAERKQTAQRLEEWKKEKRRQEEQEEELRMAEETQKRKREKEERRRQLEVKLIVEEQLRLKREEEEEQLRKRREEEQREMEERRKEAMKGIKRFNERDLHRVETKLQEKQQKNKQEEERQKRIAAKMREKMNGQVSRDPSRLTRPTKGWEERMKHIGPSGGGPVFQMFHRAVPTWRQGL